MLLAMRFHFLTPLLTLAFSLVLACDVPPATQSGGTVSSSGAVAASPSASPAAVPPAAVPPAAVPPAAVPSAGVPSDRPKLYGEALSLTQVTPLNTVLSKPEQFATQAVLVEGLVRRACSRKGCWMELATSDKGPGCRVTFKDYGFFVPTDAAGSKARVQARVESSVLSARDVRHYEREGAQFAVKNPDGTAPETRLVASGVELSR